MSKIKSKINQNKDEVEHLIEEKFFYLNGSVAENNKHYSENGNKIVENNSWYENGKLKKKTKEADSQTVYYEAYNPDGSKDQNTIQWEKNNKTGKFKVFYDEKWNVINDEKKCAFYRQIEYNNGSPIGIVKDYFSTGELQGESILKSENPDVYKGVMKNYYKNGILKSLGEFNNGGGLDGKAVNYYETGKLKDSAFYKGGDMQYSVSVNEESKKTSEIKPISAYERQQMYSKNISTPKNGLKCYWVNEFYPNGNPKIKSSKFINDDGDLFYFGNVEYYSENGVLEKTETYDGRGDLIK